MDSDQLRALQTPLKKRYRTEPAAALITLKAHGRLGEGVSCRVETGRALVEAGLHPATRGNGLAACSGDILLEALVACAGVTLSAVATAIGVEIRDGAVTAEGELDFRGTLGVSKEVPVGFQSIRLRFDLDSNTSTSTGYHYLTIWKKQTNNYPFVTPGDRPAWANFVGEHQKRDLAVKAPNELVDVRLAAPDRSHEHGRIGAVRLGVRDADALLVDVETDEKSSSLAHG
jgi:uncharacterized OsmC-like protein